MKAQHPMDPADAQRVEAEVVDGVGVVEPRRLGGLGPMRRQDPNSVARFQAPRGVQDGREARGIEPAQVVDRDEERLRPGENPERLQEATGNRGLVGRLLAGVLEAHRDRQGPGLRRGQRRADGRKMRSKDVNDTGV